MVKRILLGVLVLLDQLFSVWVLRQYHFVNQSLTWTEAQTYCRRTLTDLATIENAGELNRFNSTLSSAGYSTEVWIGVFSEIDWRWSGGFTGVGADYRDWRSSEPNFGAAKDLCVRVEQSSGWIDSDCGLNRPFICNNGTLLDPDLALVNQHMDWFSAQTYCRNNYTDLAIVRNDAENQRVKSFETNGWWPWIGLHRDLTFNWSDWSSARFHGDWNNDAKPIHSLKFICGATSTQNSGKWTFKSCETRLPFVCHGPPVWRKVVKLRLKMENSVRVDDAVLRANIMKKLQERLKQNGINDSFNLTWREHPNGEVFKKKRKTEL